MGGMAETKKSTVTIEDVSYESFQILLEVIYRYAVAFVVAALRD
jgi:hypothetical protein